MKRHCSILLGTTIDSVYVVCDKEAIGIYIDFDGRLQQTLCAKHFKESEAIVGKTKPFAFWTFDREGIL